MPTIKDKLFFNLDGVNSKSFGLLHVVTDNGMYDDIFVASRELNETKVRGNSKPMLHGVEESPLEFDMTIAFEYGFTNEGMDDLIRWLFVNHYRPLFFEGKEDRVFMAMIIGSPRIVHNGLSEGYFTVTVRCDSPQIYSPLILTYPETVATTKTITIANHGHFDIYPEISIKKSGEGNVVIESLDDGGAIFEIRNLTNQEDIYLNCEKEIIETDVIGVYRYDNLIGEFPRLLYGHNRIKVTGACVIQFKYRQRYRF